MFCKQHMSMLVSQHGVCTMYPQRLFGNTYTRYMVKDTAMCSQFKYLLWPIALYSEPNSTGALNRFTKCCNVKMLLINGLRANTLDISLKLLPKVFICAKCFHRIVQLLLLNY